MTAVRVFTDGFRPASEARGTLSARQYRQETAGAHCPEQQDRPSEGNIRLDLIQPTAECPGAAQTTVKGRKLCCRLAITTTLLQALG